MKSKTIDSFFKKKSTEATQSPSEASQIEVPPLSFAPLNSNGHPSKIPRVEDEALDLSNLERELGLRKQIYEYLVNMRDEIRRAYIKAGPYPPILSEYPASNSKRVFSNPSSHFGSTAFTHSGFSNWKKIHDGCNCTFLTSMGKDPNLLHNNAQRAYQITANRLRLKTSIDVVRWLSFQKCTFRGYDESSRSKNRGKFLEFLSLLESYDEKVEDVLKSAPQNANYTSSTKQKEILQIYASRVPNVIREKIGDRKFSIIVKERFFDIVHIKDTASLNLKNVIFNVLLQHSFDIQISELALVVAARQVVEVHQFFKDLSDIINIDLASSKRYDELQKPQAIKITRMNQIGTLQRPGETRWSSYLNSVTSLLKMYNATSMVLENLKNIASNYYQRGDAYNAYNRFRYFEFTFILHMMKEVLGVTDNLCQALQRRPQDILNAKSLVLTMKDLIQKLRDDGWNELLKNMISFCETWEFDFPDMNAQYIVGRSRNNKKAVIVEHHYRVDIFFATIDTQLQELKSRFNEHVVELLTPTTALDLKEFFKLFDIDKICILKERHLYELKHYELDVCKHPNLRKISTPSELCRSLFESGKSVMYPLVDRLIRLILFLPVSTTSPERAFSTMKIIEKEIAEKFDINKIIDDFTEVKDRRVQLK
ncbi:hypothetical protein ES288_D04G114100v1 [Gossypium darwinii]|uniref:HAT C-terminal dimerisation domain-containing protein n=1 Tax=Gossypium darwinii TaxID=34276 RepID=A0A5D2CZ80_GOSDA|nr:hypothetical protein ES288_D04G114100v1 [Gossypium darwinii]